MSIVPWRIACQSYTILNTDAEPAVTLVFDIDHNAAEACRLRIVPADPGGAAVEVEFTAGGMAIGRQVLQERWLRPFERPDPNLHLDNSEAAEEHAAGLDEGNGERGRYLRQREGYLQRRTSWANRGESDEGEDHLGERAPNTPPPAAAKPGFASRPAKA
jgi:hypothetical protein